MTTQIPATASPKPLHEPTTEQLDREKALHRFNRLYVYTPLAVAGLAVVALVALMFWRALTITPENQQEVYGLLSGLADLILIFFYIIPMILLCAIGPALFVYLLRNATKRRKLPAYEQRSKVQGVLWRVDQVVAKVQASLRDTHLQTIAGPIIQGHALAATIKAVAHYLQRIFVRAKE